MNNTSPAKIFLSDHRLMRKSALNRSFSTFNGAQAHTPNEYALYELNDEELAGGGCAALSITAESYLLLLPVTGDLSVHLPGSTVESVDIGELKINSMAAGTTVHLSNPFLKETINYLQLSIKAIQGGPQISAVCQFDFEQQDNQLIKLIAVSDLFSVSIGRFKGRTEGVYSLHHNRNHLFAFVIAGAFEVENRLLQPRDGLSLSALEHVGFEALSEGAILLFIETSSFYS